MEETLTDETFDAFVRGEERSMVWFGVDWCGNCRRLEPVLEALAQSLDVHLHKVIVDDSPQVARQCLVNGTPARYDEHGVPTIIVFENGKEKGRVVGSVPEQVLVERVAELVR